MRFVHHRLSENHIRLLRPVGLHPRILDFEVVHFPRGRAPTYTAVSYTWGDDEATEVIYLNGREFKVRTNLWSCLYYLRMYSKSEMRKHIWVDAISIDQENTSERNEQVRLMDRTYKEAACVSVWLGLVPTAQQYQDVWPERVKTLEHEGFDFFDSIGDLTSRPYWSRVWVIQECLLGQQVQLCCSNNRVDWSDFQDMLYHETGIMPYGENYEDATRKAARAPNAALPLVIGRHPDGHPQMQQPLHELLVRHHRSKCKDPRDRVFALLGLLPEDERAFLGRYFPDYFLSEEQVTIITLAHMMCFSPNEITVESEELVLGLGIKSKALRERLLRHLRDFDYLGDAPPPGISDTEEQEHTAEGRNWIMSLLSG